LAYSTDHLARALGASGGVASTLARFALEKQICKKVVTLGGTNPLDPTPMTLTKSADFIDSVYSSKYISHPIARLVTDFDEDTIVTGLPCVVESIRSYTSKPLLFGLFCSKVNTKSLLEDLSYRNHHDVSDLSSISYRTGKWPGRVEMQFNAHTVSYPLNRSIYTAISNSYYYVNQGCMLCEDYFSSDSDLSFGDPWGISLEDDFASGATVVIVRTQRGEALMNRAVNDKWLIACPLDIHTMLRGHLQGIYAKRIPLPYRRKIFQSHGCILPDSPDNAHTSMTAALLDNYYIRNNYTVKLLGNLQEFVIFQTGIFLYLVI
jgi:coenzyme F420-reducing hydrogenase beta subunit